jgi:hypothetical protein
VQIIIVFILMSLGGKGELLLELNGQQELQKVNDCATILLH